MADLSIEVLGLKYPNPFVLGSGPPGTNSKVIKRSFSLGWGGIVCKTISLENDKVHNTVPRYGKMHLPGDKKKVLGFQNIELISDRPFEVWLEELADCKQAYPEHMLIASIMEEYAEDRWAEIVERTDFPNDPPGRPMPFGTAMLYAVRFAGLTLLVNLAALVIFFVFLTEPIRLRMSLRLGMKRSLPI